MRISRKTAETIKIIFMCAVIAAAFAVVCWLDAHPEAFGPAPQRRRRRGLKPIFEKIWYGDELPTSPNRGES